MLWIVAKLESYGWVFASDILDNSIDALTMYTAYTMEIPQNKLYLLRANDGAGLHSELKILNDAFENDANFFARERDKIEQAPGGDNDVPYEYIPPSPGRETSIWCFLLGQYQRGELVS